jgi:hypothetical protein
MSTMSGSHTGQIQWLQDTVAGLWLITWRGTPLLLMLVVFLCWVILQGLSVKKTVKLQFKPCNYNLILYLNTTMFTIPVTHNE